MKFIFLLLFSTISSLACSDAVYYEGQLQSPLPLGPVKLSAPFLYAREMIASQNKVVETVHVTFKGKNFHHTWVFDNNTHQVSLRDEQGLELGQSPFSCLPANVPLTNLTTCSFEVKSKFYEARINENYLSDTLIDLKGTTRFPDTDYEYTFTGSAQAIAESQFKKIFNQRFVPKTKRR